MNSICGVQSNRKCEATSLAFVLFDFQHAGVRRRAQYTRRGEDCGRIKTVYNIETHRIRSDFTLNTFLNWKPIRFSRRDVEW